jgi:hypothetical protein
MPFIDFETELYLNRRKVDLKEQTPHFKKMTKLHEVYPRYSGSAGLQVPPTLDSSYYDMLEGDKIGVRDKDQVVYKWFKANIKQQKNDNEVAALTEFLEQLRTYRATAGPDDPITTGMQSLNKDQWLDLR